MSKNYVKIDAWKCSGCNLIIEGNEQEMREHAKVPIEKALPPGLVYTPASDFYIIVSTFTEVKIDHDTKAHGALVYLNKGGDSGDIRTISVSSRRVRQECNFCSDEELEIIREFYIKHPGLQDLIRVDPKDLTNLLD